MKDDLDEAEMGDLVLFIINRPHTRRSLTDRFTMYDIALDVRDSAIGLFVKVTKMLTQSKLMNLSAKW